MFERITKENYGRFEALMIEYYREGEDADTPIDAIKEFIGYLFQKLGDGEIEGVMAQNDGSCEGFCLWMKDEAHSEFSEVPGYVRSWRSASGRKPERKGSGKNSSVMPRRR